MKKCSSKLSSKDLLSRDLKTNVEYSEENLFLSNAQTFFDNRWRVAAGCNTRLATVLPMPGSRPL